MPRGRSRQKVGPTLTCQRRREVYDGLDCQRSEAENRIKETRLDMFGTRASCHRFLANTRPLLDGAAIEASDAKTSLPMVMPVGGLIYGEGELISKQPLRIRDVPMQGPHRQFGTRQVHLHKEGPCS